MSLIMTFRRTNFLKLYRYIPSAQLARYLPLLEKLISRTVLVCPFSTLTIHECVNCCISRLFLFLARLLLLLPVVPVDPLVKFLEFSNFTLSDPVPSITINKKLVNFYIIVNLFWVRHKEKSKSFEKKRKDMVLSSNRKPRRRSSWNRILKPSFDSINSIVARLSWFRHGQHFSHVASEAEFTLLIHRETTSINSILLVSGSR